MIEANNQLLHIRDPETGSFQSMAVMRGPKGDSDGRNAWIRFSANADGSAYTSTWSPGQKYIGFASSIAEPIDKSEYVWVDLSQLVSADLSNRINELGRRIDTNDQAIDFIGNNASTALALIKGGEFLPPGETSVNDKLAAIEARLKALES